MLPALVVVNTPVGIKVILPPPVEIGLGAVIVTIAVVPDINVIGAVGAIVEALAIVGAAAVVAINPEYFTLVKVGLPVQFVRTPLVGVPRIGVTKIGLVANTNEPVPVSSVTVAIKFALVGVVKNVATPEANPETPVAIGSPVQLVSVPDVGVPRIGVTKVGLIDKTLLPVPVEVVTPVPPFTTGKIPVIPDVSDNPKQLTKSPLIGIPNVGVTKIALVKVTFVNNKALVSCFVIPL